MDSEIFRKSARIHKQRALSFDFSKVDKVGFPDLRELLNASESPDYSGLTKSNKKKSVSFEEDSMAEKSDEGLTDNVADSSQSNVSGNLNLNDTLGSENTSSLSQVSQLSDSVSINAPSSEFNSPAKSPSTGAGDANSDIRVVNDETESENVSAAAKRRHHASIKALVKENKAAKKPKSEVLKALLTSEKAFRKEARLLESEIEQATKIQGNIEQFKKKIDELRKKKEGTLHALFNSANIDAYDSDSDEEYTCTKQKTTPTLKRDKVNIKSKVQLLVKQQLNFLVCPE